MMLSAEYEYEHDDTLAATPEEIEQAAGRDAERRDNEPDPEPDAGDDEPYYESDDLFFDRGRL